MHFNKELVYFLNKYIKLIFQISNSHKIGTLLFLISIFNNRIFISFLLNSKMIELKGKVYWILNNSFYIHKLKT